MSRHLRASLPNTLLNRRDILAASFVAAVSLEWGFWHKGKLEENLQELLK